jgi:hypothetical protein
LTKHGYRDRETQEFIETGSDVINALWPETYQRGIFCCTCQKYMLLKPVSLDYKATHWEDNCKCISIAAINQCFNNCRDNFINLYNLKTLSYQDGRFTIESAEFIGDSRINTHRRIITERDEILDNLKQAVQDQLSIEFENWTEYFHT